MSRFQIVGVDEDSVTLWDQHSRDPDHPGERAGLVTVYVGAPHPFGMHELVHLAIAKVADFVQPPSEGCRWCSVHNKFHPVGLDCVSPK